MTMSHLASSKTMFADLPPSSSVAGMRRSAAARATSRPTSVEPVNASLLIFGLSRMYWPDFEPRPVTTLNTPAGMMSCVSFASSSTVSDVVDEGLNTVQSPAASTGASFQAAMRNGKFHGTIWPTATLFKMMARSAFVVLPQVSNASHAASTARSTSSFVASAMVESCSPLAGQYTSSVPPSDASTHWPSM